MAFISVDPDALVKSHLYTGTGASNAQTGVDFQPDMTWLKSTSASTSHYVFDAVRGATTALFPDSTDPDATNAEYLKSFDSDGFTVGTNAGINDNTVSYVGWNWKAGTTSGITTNGSTTITPSAYSFNAGAGFSIIKYTGNGTSGAKLAHGLGALPMFALVKSTGTNSWGVYHVGVAEGNYANSWKYKMELNDSQGRNDDDAIWNDGAADTVNMELGNSSWVNTNAQEYIAYIWAGVKGYSQHGYYTANGEASTDADAAGTYIYTPFKPAIVLLKRFDTSGSYLLYDNQRTSKWNVDEGDTGTPAYLEPNTTGTQQTDNPIFMYSNGFKCIDSLSNPSSGKMVYSAWAAEPLVSTSGAVATAR
jgi:hypothetical protein